LFEAEEGGGDLVAVGAFWDFWGGKAEGIGWDFSEAREADGAEVRDGDGESLAEGAGGGRDVIADGGAGRGGLGKGASDGGVCGSERAGDGGFGKPGAASIGRESEAAQEEFWREEAGGVFLGGGEEVELGAIGGGDFVVLI